MLPSTLYQRGRYIYRIPMDRKYASSIATSIQTRVCIPQQKRQLFQQFTSTMSSTAVNSATTDPALGEATVNFTSAEMAGVIIYICLSCMVDLWCSCFQLRYTPDFLGILWSRYAATEDSTIRVGAILCEV